MVNLETSDGKYILSPGESIIVLTNEYIELCGKFACLILPRISLTDVGIVVSSAYVDPFYKGVMRLHISNMSDKTYELKLLEAVAQCFFFELSNEVSEEYRNDFAKKSEFYGLTWQGIMENGKEPFPTRKSDVGDGFENVKRQFAMCFNAIKKYSLVLGFSINILALIAAYTTFNSKLTGYEKKVENVGELFTKYSTEIKIPAGSSTGEKTYTVPYPKAEIMGIVCNNDKITYSIESGDTPNESKIIFLYEGIATVSYEETIEFTFILFKGI